MTMNSIEQLKSLRTKKDLAFPVVSLKGFFGSTRALHAKFPAARGNRYVILKLSEIRCHGLIVVYAAKGGGEGEAIQATYELWFDCLAMDGRGNSPDSFLLGEFDSKERADEALKAIEKLLNSTKKSWVAASVLALAWVVLFMPMPRSQPAKAPMSGPSSYNSAPRIPGGGLLAPSISSLPMPGAVGLQAPGLQAPGAPAPLGASAVPVPATADAALPAGAGASAEDDPFGLKISPSGAGSPVKR